jgi:hypothetical protein
MKHVAFLALAVWMAAAGLPGCDTDRVDGPHPLPENSFLRQIDYGCQGTDDHDPPAVQHYCHVCDCSWSTDTLSIRVCFNADCCAAFAEEVTIKGMSIDIAVADTLDECDCVCHYENEFLLLWHEPGEVLLTFSNVNFVGATVCELDTILVVAGE